jgi:hypothetical protein
VHSSITADHTVVVFKNLGAAKRQQAADFFRDWTVRSSPATRWGDWSRFSVSGGIYIEPKSPFIDSFNGNCLTSCSTSERSRPCSGAHVLADEYRI